MLRLLQALFLTVACIVLFISLPFMVPFVVILAVFYALLGKPTDKDKG